MNKYPPAIFLLFSFLLHYKSAAQNTDVKLLQSINRNETFFKDKYLELNASSASKLSVGIPAGIAIAGFIKHDKQLQRDALYMGGAYLLSGLVTQSSKSIDK